MSATPYAGQWVLKQRGQVVAHAPTAEATLAGQEDKLAGGSISLHYVDDEAGEPLALSPVLVELRPLLDGLDKPVYLVGGAVRDALLGRPSHDLDLLVPSGGIKLAFRLADALGLPAYVLDDSRDVGRVVMPGSEASIDIARYRGPDLADDLYGRDFTINAMALPAAAATQKGLIDQHGGLADLEAGRIQIIHPGSIDEDPIRALRAIRQARQLGFTLTSETEMAVRTGGPQLERVSAERVRDELVRLLDGNEPETAVAQMEALGLLPLVLPEVAALDGVEQSPPHHEPVFEHTITVLEKLTGVEATLVGVGGKPGGTELVALLEPYREGLLGHLARPVDGGLSGRSLLRWAALFHDTGKAVTKTVDADGRIRFFGHEEAGAVLARIRLQQLAMSGEAVKHVSRVVDGHMRPLLLASSAERPSRRAIYRYFKALDRAGLDVVLLSLADHLATRDGPGVPSEWQAVLEVAGALLSGYFEQQAVVVSPVRLISGSELMTLLDIPGGPEVGYLLAAIQEAQATGEVTSRDEAEALAHEIHARQQKTGS